MAFHSTERLERSPVCGIARPTRSDPELRRHPVMEPYLDAILDRFVADYPPLAPGSVAKGIMVEFWMKHAALSTSEAHRFVAKLLKMSVPTLREACRVFRIANRRGEKASGK